MTPGVIALVLFSAVLHASWNALLRHGADRLWSVTVMSFATTALALPVAAALPLPAPASWPFLALSAAFQVGYSIFLARAYTHGELSQVYPVVRGGVPVLVTLGALLLLGQRPSALALLGIALVSLGVSSLALGRGRAPMASLLPALAACAFIAGYVTADGIGVRLAGDPRAYAAWLFLAFGLLMPLAFYGRRRRGAPLFSRDGIIGLAGGAVSLVSYGAMLSALAWGPIGPVTALRETSVVFSALLSRAFLGERMTWPRLLAAAAVTAGAICLGYGGGAPM